MDEDVWIVEVSVDHRIHSIPHSEADLHVINEGCPCDPRVNEYNCLVHKRMLVK